MATACADVDMTEQTHSINIDGKKYTWRVARLWELSRDLTPFDYEIDSFDGFDVDSWYCGIRVPTVRSVLQHMRRIDTVDFSHPIILSHTGVVMDGLHRICKAWLSGFPTVPAVQFAITPPPDIVQ